MRRSSVVAAVALVGGGASAQQAGDLMSKAINKPSIEYTFYGSGYTAKVVRDAKVAGGQAYRVDVGQKGKNAWDIGASGAMVKPIHKGDAIMVAVWLRAPKLSADKTTPVPFLGVTGPAPAFAQIATGSADVGPEWKLYNARGTAAADYAPGQATVSLHLGAAQAMIDLGPVFVLDMGGKAP